MDWTSLIGPAVVAAGVSAIISIISMIVSTRLARHLHSEKLEFDQQLAERKFEFDKDLAERKFRYDRDLHDHKRKTELAEQALIAFYEASDVFVLVRSRGIFGGEGDSRTPNEGENKRQQEKRNTYFIPIERLTREKELFAQLQSLRYAFAAQFGEPAREPFNALWAIHNKIMSSASVLIQMTLDDDDNDRASRESMEPLLNTIGWGTGTRPDDIDRKIEKAIQEIEEVCRPILSGTSTK